jgi:hypothetical protein
MVRRQDARVAQLVEHATENRSVGGSNPPPGTILKSFNEFPFSSHNLIGKKVDQSIRGPLADSFLSF